MGPCLLVPWDGLEELEPMPPGAMGVATGSMGVATGAILGTVGGATGVSEMIDGVNSKTLVTLSDTRATKMLGSRKRE